MDGTVDKSKSTPQITDLEADQLQALRKWLDENPKINARTDDPSLLNFIRGCKHDLNKAKEKIERFYLMRAECPEWFTNRDPFDPKIQELLDIGVFLPLPVKDEFNRQVIIIRTSAHNPKEHDMSDVFKVGKMQIDLLLELHPEIASDGVVVIFDMRGVGMQHAMQLNRNIIKKSVDIWHVYPCKPKLLEFVNPPAHVNIVLNIFKLFMSAKMKSRVFVRRGNPTIKVPLPKELGGASGTYEELATCWKTKAEKNAEFFKFNEQFKTIL